MPPAPSTAAKAVEGTVERIVFQNPDNLWTVARLSVEGQTGFVTLVGTLPGVASGTALRASGRFVQDPTYGEQFKVEGFVPLTPDTELGIERTLGSGLVKGIGPQLAGRIVKAFGLRTLEVLEQTPWRLREVPGLGKAKAKLITEAWEAHRGTREILILLQSHGVSPALAVRIQRAYGARTAEVLRQNPYRLAQDVHGIGFLSADRIAQAFGVKANSPARAEAGLIHLLQEQASRGHVFSPRERLCVEGERTLSIPAASLGSAAERLAARGAVVRQQKDGAEIFYPAPLHAAEVSAAENVARLLRTPLRGATPLALAEGGAHPLTTEQRAALSLALDNRLIVITGGPGVGKTALVRALVELLDPSGNNSRLGAPTGRAAKRLSEATGRPAATLHRLLEYAPQDGKFARDAERPLEAELVVVDEASMIDLPLFAGLLAALPDDCRLVLVGDADQLPPVGPGAVLADLLAVEQVPAARLIHIHRQAAESQIVQAAHQVNAGNLPVLDASGRDSDFHIIEREDPADVVATIADLVAERIPQGLGIAAGEVQVLAPRHRGDAGTQSLNRALQERLNPDGARLGGGAAGGELRVGDKVMQLRNDYEKDVFNGDVGRVAMASNQGLTVMFDGRPVTYEAREAEDLQLAYACSVHKSQGSEYPAVVLALLPQHHPMLQRNLVYTALTRGRRLVVIVGSRRALRAAVQHGQRAVRFSRLAQRVRDALASSLVSRTVLFDLDGTLVDSHADLAHSVNAALVEVGLPERSIAEITTFIGEGSRRLLEKAVGSRHDLVTAAHAAWERAYADMLLDRTVLYPGVAELLERLSRNGTKMAIHTNKPGRFARPILEGLGVGGERVLGGGDGGMEERKPSPAGAQRLLFDLGADSETSLYVGDSAIDAQTAAAASLRFIGVAWGYGGEQQLREAGATVIARDAAELGEMLQL